MNETMDILSESLKILEMAGRPAEIQRYRDALLDVYSLYLQTRSSWIKEEVIKRAFVLHLLDPQFSFII
jgi:hypothetical protein